MNADEPVVNPWRHLGSVAFLLLVVCLASGIYLYAVFDTSLAGAYESGKALDAGIAGRLVRGLHRYSADGFLVFTLLHLVREALRRHYRFHRAWSWLSGVALMPLMWVAGVSGFWLAWDQRALFSATATAEWLAAWPWHLDGLARNFVTNAAMTDRFFSLIVFIHIGVPLATLAATWIHFQRLAYVRAWPPRALAVPMVAVLALLAWAWPAVSLGPADALAVPAAVALDWFYLFPHGLAAAISPDGLWIAVGVCAFVLCGAPYASRTPRPAAAVVDLANCNGCGRCAADCPFGAVVMAPRSDARAHPREALVIPDLCSSCGICAGACPSSTPFRRRTPLASGIDLPQQPVASLRAELDRVLDAKHGATVVFACAPMHRSRSHRQEVIEVECIAQVPPAFVQYALRRGASDVVLAGCPEGDCEHRLGDRWMRERIAGLRAPALRPSVPRERVRLTDEAP